MKKKLFILIAVFIVSLMSCITAFAADWVITNYNSSANGVQFGSSFDKDKMMFTLKVSANARKNDNAYWRTLGFHMSWMPDVANMTIDHSTDIIVPLRWSEQEGGSWNDNRNFYGGGDKTKPGDDTGYTVDQKYYNLVTMDQQHTTPYYSVVFEQNYNGSQYTQDTFQISLTYLMELAAVQNPAMAAHLQEMVDAFSADENSPESNFEGGLWFNAILTWYQDDGGATSGWWGRLENSGGTTGWWKNKFTPSGFILTYDDINAGQDSTTPKANTINLNKTDVNGVARTKTVRSTMIKTYFNLPIILSHQQVVNPEDMIQNSKGYVTGKSKPDFYTYNYCTDGKFRIGGTDGNGNLNAIPSYENLTNGYEADELYGQADIVRRKITNQWEFKANYREVIPAHDEQSDEDENGDGIVDTNDKRHIPEQINEGELDHYTITREAAYWYINDARFYVLNNVETENEVFPYRSVTSGRGKAAVNKWKYLSDCNDSVGNDTQIICEVNGVDMSTISTNDAQQAFVASDTYHINWNTIWISKLENGTAVNDYGTIHKSRAAAQSEFNAWASSQVPQDQIQSRNDKLEIKLKDGSDKVYMHNNYYPASSCPVDINQTDSFFELTDTAAANSYGSDVNEGTGLIPATTANGEYYTTIKAFYQRKIVKPDDTVCVQFEKTSADTQPVDPETGITDPAIIGRMDKRIYNHNDPYGINYQENEPVRVHTPTVGSFELQDQDRNKLDPSDTHQLVQNDILLDGKLFTTPVNRNVDAELLLDGTYNIHFNPGVHLEHLGYDASQLTDTLYDKYCAFKQTAFPFTVQINGVVYEPSANNIIDGIEYTDWIYIDHFDQEYYVPTWAVEKGDHVILVRVAPINVVDQNGDVHIDDEEWLKNQTFEGKPLYEYVSTYSNTVQLSGIIYDFQAVGVTNRDEFIGKNPDTGKSWGFGTKAQQLALCPLYQEKKSGVLNRLGGTSVRYTYNGMLNNNWDEMNTLPFSNSRSEYYKGFGYLRKGDTFAFSVKTIANLSDYYGDYLYIIPTFRYISKEGQVNDDVTVYYKKATDKGFELVKYGSDQDRSHVISLKLFDNMFNGAYNYKLYDFNRTVYQDDVEFSAQQDGWTGSTDAYLQRETESYILSAIKLNSKLRLMTGNLTELAMNADNDVTNLTNMTTGTVDVGDDPVTGKVSAVSHIYDLTETKEPEMWEEFRKSMQTWYGEYFIPNQLFVTDKEFKADADGDGVDETYEDVWDYANEKGYIDLEEDFFKKEGYLVINFQIYTFNNDKSHLAYSGSNGDNMWTIQGQPDKTTIGDPSLDEEIEVPVKPGDVAIVDLETSVNDGWTVGTNRIN